MFSQNAGGGAASLSKTSAHPEGVNNSSHFSSECGKSLKPA